MIDRSQACAQLAVNAIRCGRSSLLYRMAIFHMKAAIRYANQEGYPPSVKSPLFRMINWLRADLRKMQKEIV